MISCLTITQNGRQALLACVMADFAAQTLTDRELLVVHDGGHTLDQEVWQMATAYPGALIRVLATSAGQSLGALRNLSVQAAHGDFICQWDDDDRYHPLRLAIQWQALVDSKAEFCFLCDQLHAFRAEGLLAWDDWYHDAWPMNFIQGTLLGRRALMPVYPQQRRGEDTPLIIELLRSGLPIARVRDAGWCYIYVCHDSNAWDSEHHVAISRAKGLDTAQLLGRQYLLRQRLGEYQPALGPLTMPCGSAAIHF